eukprot:gb/GFBE01044783.1/.p1 GENE.gb/GFBE01044783.1/~~gb/GFBE01044783.1/.p1  ORF type:complete len:354 (+),score=66.29 gb/GFBE01044783.1/:1-1062(+)
MAVDVATHAPWNFFRGFLDASDAPALSSDEEVCRALWQSLEELVSSDADSRSTASEAVQEALRAVLRLLEDRQGCAANVSSQLLDDNTPFRLVSHLDFLDFEGRKYAMRTFSAIVKHSPSGKLLEYMRARPQLTEMLLDGSGSSEVSIHCSSMLRACTRSEGLVAMLLEQGAASRLIDLAGRDDFDISSEAFASLRELLSAQPATSALYLQVHFDNFFGSYHALLQAEGAYTTRRCALRLLGDVLTARPFMTVMVKYVSSPDWLQLHMNLLRDPSRAIQLDTFHIFKIFVANPNKPRRVHQILHRNKDRLIKHLEAAVGDKSARNEALHGDLKTVIRVLTALEAPALAKSVSS